MDRNTPDGTISVSGGAIDISSGVDETNNAILDLIDKTIHRYDVYADSNTPSFVFNNEEIRKKFLDFKSKRGGHIRYITEITKDNIDYCKQIMKAVELRHIQGPKGVFRVNETEYQYNAVLDDSKAAILIRSKIKEVVNQQQIVFDALWNKAIPAVERIREVQDDDERKAGTEMQTEDKIRAENANITTDKGIDAILDNINSLHQSKEIGKSVKIFQNPTYKIESPQPISKKLQLWSNSTNSEYAVRLEGASDILAATNQDVASSEYTNFVEQADYLDDLKYDWEYTLKHWTSNHYQYIDSSSGSNKNTDNCPER